MRDYAKVSPKVWTGSTGKAMRGHVEAQIVAMYLMSSPHSEMTGVYTCPILYIAHETGLGMEGASKGLRRLIEIDFCTYEEETETIFVHEMAKYQIGEELKVNDNQVKSVRKAFAAMKGVIRERFFDRYKVTFHLDNDSPSKQSPKPLASPLQAPSKPREGAGERTGDIPAKKNKTSLPADFGISERVREWATEKGHTQLDAHLENFISAAKRKGYTYVDWDEAFMEAIRKDWAKLGLPKPPGSKTNKVGGVAYK